MIPEPFDYFRVESAEETISLLGEHGDDAKVIAGGQSLLPLMKLRLAAPAVVIDIGRLRDLSYIDDRGDHIAIGALARHCDLVASPLVRANVPMLSGVASVVGDPQVRHRGTIGGSLVHGDPAADLPAIVVALGGELVVQGPAGQRVVSAADFFLGFMQTALAEDELLTEVRVPKAGGAGWSYQKFRRRAQDWAIVGAAVVRNPGPSVVLVNMGQTTIRASVVERALAAGASIGDAAELAAEDTEPSADINASADYRRHLARVLVRRGLEESRVHEDRMR